jgi:hypothetical protein
MVWCIKLYGDRKVFTSTDTLSGLFCYICLSLIVWSRLVCFLGEIAYSCMAFWKEELECLMMPGEGAETVYRLSGG